VVKVFILFVDLVSLSEIHYSKVFGNHTLVSSARFRPNSSVTKMSAQQKSTELEPDVIILYSILIDVWPS
jgi:hypothetical protein